MTKKLKNKEKIEEVVKEKQKDTEGKHIGSLTYVEVIPYHELQKGDPHAPSDKSDFDIRRDLTVAYYSKLFEYPLVDVYVKNITNIRDILQVNKKFSLSDDIKVSLKKKMQFYRITLAATFESPLDVRIDWGKLSVSTKIRKSMVHSVYPDRIDDITKVNKKYALDASLKLQSFGVELEPGFSYVDERAYDIIHPQIVGTYRKQEASWQFNTTNSRNYIHGTQELEFVVKQPSNIISEWSAEIEAKISWARPLRRFEGRIRNEKLEAKNKIETFKVPRKD